MGLPEVVSISSDLLKSPMCHRVLSTKGFQLFISLKRMTSYLPIDRSAPRAVGLVAG